MLTYEPFKTLTKSRLGLNPESSHVNVGEMERYGSIIGGAALIAAAIWRRSIPGALLGVLGGAFIWRGITGHCACYEALGLNRAGTQRPGVPDNAGIKLEKSITIERPPDELYRF